MYKVYGTLRSRAFRVLWALEELGQPYEVIEAAPRSDEIRAVNRWGKVPALQDGDDIITDSVAIMTYLADKHGGLTHPAGTIARAKQDAMTHRLLDEFDAVLWTATRHAAILPPDLRAPDATAACKWEFEQSANNLSEDFVGPFLTGDVMTIADILAVQCISWARAAEFPPVPQNLRDYAKEMRARPAFTAVVS